MVNLGPYFFSPFVFCCKTNKTETDVYIERVQNRFSIIYIFLNLFSKLNVLSISEQLYKTLAHILLGGGGGVRNMHTANQILEFQ